MCKARNVHGFFLGEGRGEVVYKILKSNKGFLNYFYSFFFLEYNLIEIITFPEFICLKRKNQILG